MKDLNSHRVQQHFYKTLRKYGINSGLAMQLHYNNSYYARTVFSDHDYCKDFEELYDNKVLRTRFQNLESHEVWHSNLNYVSSSEVTDLGDVRLVKETVDQKDQTQILMHEHQHGLM